jgi:Carboxypeptidase regulatory-like domain
MILVRFLLLTLFSVSLLLIAHQSANACSCGPRGSVLDSFDGSDEVVVSRVMSVEKAENTENRPYVDGVKSATMVVEKVFKGKLKPRDEIVFGQGGGADCIWTFNENSVGHQYLFYLDRPETLANANFLPSKEPGLWFAFGCGRSNVLAGATEDLLYLEKMKKVRGKTRISGSIGGGSDYPDLSVAGKKIKIIGPNKTYVTKTDKDGVFEIYDVPPGKYFVEPEIPSGWMIHPFWLRYSRSIVGAEAGEPEMKSPSQIAITLEPRKHASLYIVFTVDNSVRGRVLDPKGRPMDRVCVYLLRPDQEKYGPMSCTDEQGRFEIIQIPAGEYVLVANADGKPSADEPFQKVYYPHVLEREKAAPINVVPGARIENLDIVIPKLEETITIEGVLRYSDGNPVIEE